MKISIAICCHNSAQRIEKTLQHLQKQEGIKHEQWEILIIDNASNDATGMEAQKVWNQAPIAPLRVIQENNLGLSYARERALRESSGDVIAFIDDDNWANPKWVKHVIHLFAMHPEITAAGGPIHPVLESPPPEWFAHFKGNFTLWDLYPKAQFVAHPLCGAGLCIRKLAWEELIQKGFRQQLADRSGENLSSGGDFELCYAFLLNGGHLWYDPELKIEHFIPQKRLQWNYLMNLRKGFGAQSTVLEVYEMILKSHLKTQTYRPKTWWKEALKCLYHCIRNGYKAFPPESLRNEGKDQAAFFAEQTGRLAALWKDKFDYDDRYQSILNQIWIAHKN
jgi:glycosyltransferase involved in cell wall biosynthesis